MIVHTCSTDRPFRLRHCSVLRDVFKVYCPVLTCYTGITHDETSGPTIQMNGMKWEMRKKLKK